MRRYLSRFLVVVVVALAIESLVGVMRALHAESVNLVQPAATAIGAAALLAAWGTLRFPQSQRGGARARGNPRGARGRPQGAVMAAFRKQLLDMLAAEPRTASSLARELQLDRRTMEEDLRHMIRSARAAGHRVIVEPARCKSCGFEFGAERLSKPGRCPECRGTWLFEPLLRVEKDGWSACDP